MKNLNLIVGVLVAVALVVGVYLARQAREATGEAPPAAAEPVDDAPGDAVPEGLVPDVTREDGAFRSGGLTVHVAVPARPIKAYEETTYRLQVTDASGGAVALDAGIVKFNMSMDMGRHHYALEPAGTPGRYTVKAPIPMCPSGKVRWYGNMELTVDGAVHEGSFQFDITP